MAHLPRIKTRLALHSHRRTRSLLQGEYAAVSLGRSLDFHDVREYVRGDDVRDLDWKATARTGVPLVKRFTANRKHTVLLVVSTGREMAAAAGDGSPKRDVAVTVAGLVGWLAVRHGDVVTCAYGDAGGCHGTRPSGRELDLERTLGALHDAMDVDGATADLTGLLRHVARTVRRRTIMLVVADDPTISDEVAAALRIAVAQHEVLYVHVADLDPSGAGEGGLTDVVSRADLPEWARGDGRLMTAHAEAVAGEAEQRKAVLAGLGIPQVSVGGQDEAIAGVFRLLESQRHARRR
jgi:uncharacterized protein (DUF58 family)